MIVPNITCSPRDQDWALGGVEADVLHGLDAEHGGVARCAHPRRLLAAHTIGQPQRPAGSEAGHSSVSPIVVSAHTPAVEDHLLPGCEAPRPVLHHLPHQVTPTNHRGLQAGVSETINICMHGYPHLKLMFHSLP